MIVDAKKMKQATIDDDKEAYTAAEDHATSLPGLNVLNSTVHQYLLNDHKKDLKAKMEEEKKLKEAIAAGEDASKEAMTSHATLLAGEERMEKAKSALVAAEKETVAASLEKEKKKQELSVFEVKNEYLAPTMKKGGYLEQAIRAESLANWSITRDTTALRACRDSLAQSWSKYDMVLVKRARACVVNFTQVVANDQVYHGVMDTIKSSAIFDVERMGRQQFDVEQLSKKI